MLLKVVHSTTTRIYYMELCITCHNFFGPITTSSFFLAIIFILFIILMTWKYCHQIIIMMIIIKKKNEMEALVGTRKWRHGGSEGKLGVGLSLWADLSQSQRFGPHPHARVPRRVLVGFPARASAFPLPLNSHLLSVYIYIYICEENKSAKSVDENSVLLQREIESNG